MREAVLQKISPEEAIPSPAAPPIRTTARFFVGIKRSPPLTPDKNHHTKAIFVGLQMFGVLIGVLNGTSKPSTSSERKGGI
jgi:hypothetical protein